MKFPKILQNLLERVGLTEPLPPPPTTVDMPVAEPRQLAPILARLAALGVRRVHWTLGDAPDGDDLVALVERTAQLGMEPAVRGRAGDLHRGTRLADLAAAGAKEVEPLFVSSIAEVHDALAGGGDYRLALAAIDRLATLAPFSCAQMAITPATRNSIGQTVEFLVARGISEIRLFAVVCRDDEPSSWALSPSELLDAARVIEQAAPAGL